MEQELLALQVHRNRLLDLPNVVGVGIGPKMRGGMRSGETAVVILVKKKMPETQLQSENIVPTSVDGVATDIIEVGEIRLLERTNVIRPACPGSSIGHYKVSAGTFGAVVYDRRTKAPLIISNNHILANISNGRDGRCALGDPIYQPGSYDGGTADDAIAKLYRFVPIEYQEKGKSSSKKAPVNRVDAAVASPISADVISDKILEIGTVTGIAKPAMNMKVKKSGRTSGLTSGRIRVTHTTLKVDMDDNRFAVFEDQVVTDMVSKPGDSGSLVVNEGGEAVGLLFAGSERSAIFSPIENVLAALDITMFGGTPQTNPSAPAQGPSTTSPQPNPILAGASSSTTIGVLLLMLLLYWLYIEA